MKKILSWWFRQCQRELIVTIRQPHLIVNALLFFLMVVIFFPLSLPPEKAFFHQLAPGLLWLAMLLAMLLASERLWQTDYEHGVLEQWLLSGYALTSYISAKIIAQWLTLIIPVLLFAPLLMPIFAFSKQGSLLFVASLLIGSPALITLCALAAAFGTTVQQRGMFMALILLPLATPILIFGSSAVLAPVSAAANLALLAAFSLLAAGLLPFAIAAVIRISLND